MLYIIMSCIILMILTSLGNILMMKSSNKGTDPFECGFSPASGSHKPFSSHFFLLGMIFVVFDLEIVLLFPLIKMYSYLGWIFCLILFLGLIYEWYLGSLNWL